MRQSARLRRLRGGDRDAGQYARRHADDQSETDGRKPSERRPVCSRGGEMDAVGGLNGRQGSGIKRQVGWILCSLHWLWNPLGHSGGREPPCGRTMPTYQEGREETSGWFSVALVRAVLKRVLEGVALPAPNGSRGRAHENDTGCALSPQASRGRLHALLGGYGFTRDL
jgi:hypothetical protein